MRYLTLLVLPCCRLTPALLYRVQDRMPPAALALLDHMLRLDPGKRITAGEALNSPWLQNVDPEK